MESSVTLQRNGLDSALFSPCETYRYKLQRDLSEKAPMWTRTSGSMVFIMLNPSTADAFKNDPTVARCERRAIDAGKATLTILNLFAYRATNPKDMKSAADPVGRENNAVIENALRVGKFLGDMDVICAWGTHGTHNGRNEEVLAILREFEIAPMALKVTKAGHPGHPLYISNDALPFRFAA